MPSQRILDRFINNARVHLPGALDTVFRQEFFNVVQEFFATTNTWLDRVVFVTVQDQREYEVVPAVGTFVRYIGLIDEAGFPRPAAMPQIGILRIEHPPNGDLTYQAVLAVTCTDPVRRDGWPECPEELLIRFFEAIMEGLLGRMMMQPAKPYSNPDLGTLHQRRFHDRMAVARVDALHQFTFGAQAWRFPRFA